MAIKVIMPKQGLQMTEGTITKWAVAEGQKVEAEQPLFEMETDKLNIEIGASVSGTLLKIIRGVGEVVPITEIIAVIGQPGEDISGIIAQSAGSAGPTASASASSQPQAAPAIPAQVMPAVSAQAPAAARSSAAPSTVSAIPFSAPAAPVYVTVPESFTAAAPAAPVIAAAPLTKASGSAGGRIFITPRAKMLANEKGMDVKIIPGSGPDGLIIEKDVAAFAVGAISGAVPGVTPIARQFAEVNGIGLGAVGGTGIGGRITTEDVEAAAASGRSKMTGQVIPFAGMRKAISDNMMKSLHGMAQANHRMKVDMTEAIRLREKLAADGMKISYNDILIRVVAGAMLEVPIMNSVLTPEGIVVRDHVNIGFAVALENGLIVPVIKSADRMTVLEIARASAELADKAKNGRLKHDEYTGGTFTITNLGMYDIDEFTAIINPPEVGILAVGKITKTPVVEGESIVIRPIMTMSLTYDHRIVDGAPAARFLQQIRKLLQTPYLLI